MSKLLRAKEIREDLKRRVKRAKKGPDARDSRSTSSRNPRLASCLASRQMTDKRSRIYFGPKIYIFVIFSFDPQTYL